MTRGAGRASPHLVAALLHCLRACNSQHRFQMGNLQTSRIWALPISGLQMCGVALGQWWASTVARDATRTDGSTPPPIATARRPNALVPCRYPVAQQLPERS